MKTKTIILFFIFILLVDSGCHKIAPEITLESRSCTYGAVSATFNRVDAIQNCPIPNDTGNYQCVSLVEEYYLVNYGLNLDPFFGNANSYFTNTNHIAAGIMKFKNGEVVPQIGDILVSTAGSYGHVAMIIGLTATTVTIMDQNFSESSKRTLTRNGNIIGGFSTKYTVTGLLRKAKAAAIPAMLLPLRNSIDNVAPLKFAWNSTDADNFRLQIIEASQFKGFTSSGGFSGTMSYNANVGFSQSFIWTGPIKGKTYFWTVRAANQAGTSSFAPYSTFKMKSL